MHEQETAQRNHNNCKQIYQNYDYKITEKYVCLICGVSKKCRFMFWYNCHKDQEGNPVDIKYFRTIIRGHDIAIH